MYTEKDEPFSLIMSDLVRKIFKNRILDLKK